MEGQFLNLSFSWLLLLPVIAGMLIFQGTWLDDGISARGRPKKYQRRLKAKILIHRALIINLLLATFFVFTSSLTVLPDIVQGLLLTVVLMLPILIYLSFIVFKWPFKKTSPTTVTDEQPVPNSSSSVQPVDTSRAADSSQVSPLNARSIALERGAQDPAIQTRSVESLQVYTIENHDRDSSIEKTAQQPQDHEMTPAPSYGELSEMVVSLQKNEINLRKLVAAQKAVIDTEKQRHQKAKMLAQNAMTVVAKAREGARVALRVAQQERTERLRLEADNARADRRLDNGPSTTHTRKTTSH